MSSPRRRGSISSTSLIGLRCWIASRRLQGAVHQIDARDSAHPEEPLSAAEMASRRPLRDGTSTGSVPPQDERFRLKAWCDKQTCSPNDDQELRQPRRQPLRRAMLSDRVLYIDAEAIVLDKPAGLPVTAVRDGALSLENHL